MRANQKLKYSLIKIYKILNLLLLFIANSATCVNKARIFGILA